MLLIWLSVIFSQYLRSEVEALYIEVWALCKLKIFCAVIAFLMSFLKITEAGVIILTGWCSLVHREEYLMKKSDLLSAFLDMGTCIKDTACR